MQHIKKYPFKAICNFSVSLFDFDINVFLQSESISLNLMCMMYELGIFDLNDYSLFFTLRSPSH